MSKFTKCDREKITKTLALRKNVEELVDQKLPNLPAADRPAVVARLEAMPEGCRMPYVTAMGGSSRAAGVEAACAHCFGWEDWREGAKNCQDHACPLFPYRPGA